MWYKEKVAKEILKRKYLHDGETFNDFVKRVSSIFEVSIRDKMRKAIRNGDFFPAGRILYGAGLEKQGKHATPFNCYVLPSPKDSIEEIYNVNKKAARVASYGGGYGTTIDYLRPKNAKVNNSAKTSTGAVSFLELFNTTGNVIGQEGRRSATMIGLICTHPDLEEFLKIKETNHKLESMNISIKFTDDFFKAVEQNKMWKLHFEVPETGEVIEREIDARKFFERFCQVNADWGDPGAIFIDAVNKNHLLSGYDEYKIEISNPCFTGDMKLLTTKGYIPFKELEGKTVRVIKPNGEISSKDSPVFKTGTKKVISLMIGATKKSTLKEIKCTPNHIFKTFDGDSVEAKDLKGKRLQIPKVNTYTSEEELKYERLGFIQGDGCYHHTGDKKIDGLVVFIGEKDNDVKEIFTGLLSNGSNNSYMVTSLKPDAQEIGIKDERLCNRNLPKNYNNLPVNSKRAFLKGLFSANGCVLYSDDTKRVQFKTTNKALAIELVKELKAFDIIAYITTNKKSMVKWHNGNYESKESYNINISQSYSLLMFYQQIGFIQKYKMEKLYDLVSSLKIKVVDIIDNNEVVDVFDFTEHDEHWGVVEGVVAHNCSEFMGAPYTACCLGSINLYNCVEHKFSDKAFFNFDKLKYLVEIGVIALNNVLDYGYDKQPLPENQKAIKDWRNIGLGFFGLADALVALGIKYGSYEAQSLAYDITNTMMMQALDTSCDLAYDDGPFDKFDWEKTKNNPIMGKLSCTNKKLYNDIKEFGLRNGSLISIAPTGSISLLVGETGGIEPFFKVSYERTTHKLEADAEKSNTEKQTFKVFPISIRELLAYHNLPETLSNEEIKKRFPFIVEASEIPYTERIAMQQACQANIDNAISSTINLPNSATANDIAIIYMAAWRAGLKGITVFRDGCKRLSILNPKKVSKNSEQEQKQDTKPMSDFGKLLPKKRGNIVSLPAITYKGQSACARLYSTITGLNGHPFEVFINPTGGCNANINTIGRLTSLLLRSGVAPEVVIEELSSQKCPACQQLRKQGRTDVALSCGNAIANALKDFNKNKAVHVEPKVIEEPTSETNTQSETEREKMKCPKCGAELRNTGKCVSCDVCGWNTCGD